LLITIGILLHGNILGDCLQNSNSVLFLTYGRQYALR